MAVAGDGGRDRGTLREARRGPRPSIAMWRGGGEGGGGQMGEGRGLLRPEGSRAWGEWGRPG